MSDMFLSSDGRMGFDMTDTFSDLFRLCSPGIRRLSLVERRTFKTSSVIGAFPVSYRQGLVCRGFGKGLVQLLRLTTLDNLWLADRKSVV